MKDFTFKKILSLLLCAFLCVGLLPMEALAMEAPEAPVIEEIEPDENNPEEPPVEVPVIVQPTGLTDEQRAAVLNRPMAAWTFPLPEDCMDDVVDFAGCRGGETAALYGTGNYSCPFGHGGSEFGSVGMVISAAAGVDVFAPTDGTVYYGYDGSLGNVAVIEQALGDGYSYYVLLSGLDGSMSAGNGAYVSGGTTISHTSGAYVQFSAVMAGSGLGGQIAASATQVLTSVWDAGWLTESRGMGRICVNPASWTQSQYTNSITAGFPGPIGYGFSVPQIPETTPTEPETQPTEPTIEIIPGDPETTPTEPETTPTEPQPEAHTHVFDQMVTTEQFLRGNPTCGEAATYYYSCTCGLAGSEYFTFGQPGEHIYSADWSSDDTYHWHSAICGHEVTGDLSEHSFGAANVIAQPSHTASGRVEYACTVCGYVKTEEQPAGGSHVFDQMVASELYLVSPANCQNAAQYAYSCLCGERGTETFSFGVPTGEHVWVTETVQPTHTQSGSRTSTCSACGATNFEVLPVLAEHTFDQMNTAPQFQKSSATCDAPAEYYYSCICGEMGTQTFASGTALGHSFAEIWSMDETRHWHQATCGHTDQMGSLGEHTWNEGTYSIQPTHTSAGQKEYTCTTCGYVKSETIPASAEHVFNQEVADARYLVSEATCSAPATYRKSCVCGEAGTETFASGALKGHTFSDQWSSDGNGHWHQATCGHTGELGSYDIHAWDTGRTTTEASHTAGGQAIFTCTVCGYSKTEALPALSHVFDRQIVEDRYQAAPAGCTQGATYYLSCVCGEKGTETFTTGEPKGHTFSQQWSMNETQHWLPAICEHINERVRLGDHIWNPGQITVQPTATTKGVKTYTCTTCGATRTEEVAPSAHTHTYSSAWSMDNTAHWQAATCEHKDAIYNYALHSWDGGVVSKAASHYSTGEIVYTCTVCRQIRTETTVQTHTFDQKIATANYQKSGATCVSAPEFYYSCTCGAKGTGTFFAGTPQGHSYYTSWSKDDNYHYHSCMICGSKGELQPHSFSQDGGICLICGYTKADAHIHTSHLTYVPAVPPTCTVDGNTAYYSCSCGKEFTDSSAAVAIANHATVVVPATGHVDNDKNGRCDSCNQRLETQNQQYNILSGADATWVNNSESGLVFRSEAEFSTFDHVEVDNVTISPEYYNVGEGSTIVELKPSYMKQKLTVGRHAISIVSTGGRATTSFTVKQAAAANTSDNTGNSINWWLIAAVLALVLLIGASALLGYLIYTGKLGGKKGKYSR